MSNPISNLKSLDLLRPQDLNCNIFSVYDYEGLTIQELLCQFFEKINECVNISNATFKLAEWLVSVGLKQEVAITLNKWLEDGTLKEIINEEIFSELNNLLKITKDKVINVVEFGADKTGLNDSTIEIQKAFDSVEKYIIPNFNLEFEGVSCGKIVIDLAGGRYKISKTINLPINVSLSNIIIQNGTLIASENLTSNMIRIGGDVGHAYENVFQNIMLIGNNKCNGIYLKDCLTTTIDKCNFHNVSIGIIEELNCHETNIVNCSFRGSKLNICDIAMKLNQDSIISNNTVVYYKKGIQLSSNANFINNNHFYGISEYGIESIEGSMFNNISYNYFDGCSIKLARGGYRSEIIGNQFIDTPKYSCIYLEQRNQLDWLQQVIIQNNIFGFRGEEIIVDGSILNNVITSTSPIFTIDMLGSVIQSDNKVEKCVIKKIISETKCEVVVINGFNNSFNGFKIKPTNISFLHNIYSWDNIVNNTFIVNNNLQEVGYMFESGNSNGTIKNYKNNFTSFELPIEVLSIEKSINSGGIETYTSNKPVNFIKFESICRALPNKESIGYAYFNPMFNLMENKCHYELNGLMQKSDSECFVFEFDDGTSVKGVVTQIDGFKFKINFITTSNKENNVHILAYVY